MMDLINDKSKIKVIWENTPDAISTLTKHQLKLDLAKKYNIPTTNIEIIPKYLKITNNNKKNITLGDKIKTEIFNKNNQRAFYERYFDYVGLLKDETFDKEEFFKLDNLISTGVNNENTHRNYFKVERLWAQNLLSYSFFEKNFQDGIEVISSIPFNGSGKSNVINICKIALFGEFKYGDTRTKLSDIFNENTHENEAYSNIIINIDGIKYLISRVFIRKNNSVSQSVNFLEITEEEKSNCFFDTKFNELVNKEDHNRMMDGFWTINLNKKSSKNTQEIINNKIGTLDDFYYSGILSGKNISKWLETKATERVTLFYGYFGLENINVKGDLAKKEYLLFKKKSNLDRVSPALLLEEIDKLTDENKSYTITLQILNETIEKEEEKLNIINNDIKEESKKYYKLPDYFLNYSQEEEQNKLKTLEIALDDNKKEFLNIKSKIIINQDNLNGLEVELKKINTAIFSIKADDILIEEKNKITNQKYEIPSEYLDKIKNLEEQKLLKREKYIAKKSEIEIYQNKLNTMEDIVLCKQCGLEFNNKDEKSNLTKSIAVIGMEMEQIVKDGVLIKNEIDTQNEIVNQQEKQFNQKKEKQLIEINFKIEESIKQKQKEFFVQKENIETRIKKVNENENNKQLLLLLESKINELKTQIDIKTSRIQEYNKSLSNIEYNKTIDDIITDLESKRTEIIRIIKEINTEINDITSLMTVNKQNINKNNLLIIELQEDIKKDALYQNYIRVHDKFDGISRFIIESYIPIMNESLKFVLNECTDFDVEIKFLDKKIEFFYKKGNEVREVYRTSGFQSDAASLAIHYTLMKLTTINIPNFLFIDEIFGSTAEGNLTFIHKIIEKMLDIYDNIFIISHHPAVMRWAEQFNYKIQMVINNGSSILYTDDKIIEFKKYYDELTQITSLNERIKRETEILNTLERHLLEK